MASIVYLAVAIYSNSLYISVKYYDKYYKLKEDAQMEDINVNDELAEKFRYDPFPRHLGIKIIKLSPGYARVSLQVQDYMTNILRITHGGIVFTLADVALGIASNARGQASVAMSVTINFIKASKPGNILYATAEEIHSGRRTANYRITIEDDKGKLIALAQGLVFQESK